MQRYEEAKAQRIAHISQSVTQYSSLGTHYFPTVENTKRTAKYQKLMTNHL